MAQWTDTDTFAGRTVSSNTTGSWGTASDGESWSCLQGSGAGNNFAVASGEGTMNTTGTPVIIMKLGSNSGTDMDVTCRISPGASSDTIAIFARISDSTHYYRLDLTGTTIQVAYKNGGSFTSIKTASSGMSFTVGTFYSFRLRVIGTSLYGKAWLSSGSEPQSWGITATDSNITSGGVGCGCNPHSSVNNVQFDTFQAVTLDAVLTDTITFDDSASGGTNNPIDRGRLQASYRTMILNDGAFAYYRLGESSGTVANDETVNLNSGTIAGGVTLAQPGALYADSNTSMLFDGSTGKITLPTSIMPTGANPWTVEGWGNATVVPGSYGLIAGFGKRNNQQAALLFFHNNGSGKFQAMLSTYSGDMGSSNLVLNNWYHVVGTYDGTQARLYVNGVLASGPTSFTMNISNTFAGIGSDSGTDWFTGYLDECAFYNVALSTGTVLAHYNMGSQIYSETLSVTDSPTFTDTGTVADSMTEISVPILTDTSPLTDTSANTSATTLAGSGSLTDTTLEITTTTGTDTLSFLDAGNWSGTISIVDPATVSDILSLLLSETVTGAGSMGDAGGGSANTIATDILSPTDAGSWSSAISLADLLTASDLPAMLTSQTFSDQLSFSDLITLYNTVIYSQIQPFTSIDGLRKFVGVDGIQPFIGLSDGLASGFITD